VLGLVAVGAPAALVTIARSRFGGAAPWSGWAITGLPDLEDVTGVLAEPLDTTSLVDLVLRATLLLGWGAVAVVVVSTVVETVDRLRHRDAVAPAAAAPRLGRVGGPGRWIAAGLLALLPMVATVRAPVRPALAEFGVGAPRAAAVVDVVVDAAVPPVGGVALVGHPAAARVHTVVPGDTLSGIAAAHLDDASRWPEIWTDNRDRLMPDGRIFSDPNLILPGWPLVVDVDLSVMPRRAPRSMVATPIVVTTPPCPTPGTRRPRRRPLPNGLPPPVARVPRTPWVRRRRVC
jgi:LysM repeat protein